MKNLLLLYIRCLCVCMLLLVIGCGNRNAHKCTDDIFAVEHVVQPVFEIPLLDESRFAVKVYIECSAKGVTVSSLPSGVTVENNGKMVLLHSAIPGVEYVVSGSSADASLAIVSNFSPLVTLDGLSLTSHGENALQVSSEEYIYLRSVGNSVIADVASADKADSQSAAIKLMGRSVLCGGGIVVNAARRSAVFCTDTLYVADMLLSLSGAPNNALLSNKSIFFSAGVLSASSTKDVVKCKSGDFVMSGGTVSLSSDMNKADGVQASGIYVSGGSLSVVVSGAASDGLKAKGNLCISGGAVSVSAKGGAMFNEKKSDYSSASCLKSDAVIDISGGNCTFDALGDGSKGISCDSLLIVSGGSLCVVTSGSDVVHPLDVNAHSSSKGIKSDGDIYFLGGDIEVAVLGEGERSEGVESKKDMYIGGDTRLYVYAYDDALNAANLRIAGGNSYFYSVANDAVDSNGRIDMSDGTVVADGSFAPEQGVDVDDFSAFAINGGTLFSIGGSMGPYPSLPLCESSTVPVVAWSGVSAAKECFVSLADADGELLFGYSMPRNLEGGAALFASDKIRQGAEYTLALSENLDGAGYHGNGFYHGGHASGILGSVTFEIEGLVNGVSNDGKVTVVEPGKGTPLGTMPPPPFPHHGDSVGVHGVFPPPPPMRNVKSEYGLGNLPNNDRN